MESLWLHMLAHIKAGQDQVQEHPKDQVLVHPKDQGLEVVCIQIDHGKLENEYFSKKFIYKIFFAGLNQKTEVALLVPVCK